MLGVVAVGLWLRLRFIHTIRLYPDEFVTLDSLAFNPVPVSAEISDVAFLLSLGYRTFLLGDAICLQREPLLEALNLLQEISGI